jgi:IS1 family transposase
VQFDEKWAFVEKKEKHCDADESADGRCGDCWDHVGIDPEHRLVLSVVVGKRNSEHVRDLIGDFRKRTENRIMNLITTDEYPVYETELLAAYGELVVPPRTGQRGRPAIPYLVPPAKMNYATVHKIREKSRVVAISYRVIFGTDESVEAALQKSKASRAINTAFVERHNGTDRNRNGRKVRKTYCFSKDWEIHEAVTYFTMFSYNFCWPVRTLRKKDAAGQWQPRTPAMVAGLTDHVWPLHEWLSFPVVQW